MPRLTRQKKHQIRTAMNLAMAARIRTVDVKAVLEHTSIAEDPEVVEYAQHWINTTAAMVGRETTATETEGT